MEARTSRHLLVPAQTNARQFSAHREAHHGDAFR
jgi:hypothetical protein